jgi:hypothetical protein
MLAGIPVPDQLVLVLAARLREASINTTAQVLEDAWDAEHALVGLTISDREAILRVLDDCPDGLDELRAVLVQEHVWRRREASPRPSAPPRSQHTALRRPTR